MRVNRFTDIFGAAAELKDRHSFRDKFRGAQTDNLRSQQSVCFWVGQDFYEPLALVVGQRSAVGDKWEFADFDGYPFLFGKIFGEADSCNFGIGIDDVWNRVIVDMAGFTGNSFDARNAFVFSFVREHRPFNNVSDRVESRNIRSVMFVDRDAATFG